MSLHCACSDVEGIKSSYAQEASNVELLRDASFNISHQSSSTVIARRNKRSDPRTKFHFRLWARVTKLFVDWWMGELLAILISVIALFGIILIRRKYNSHTLSKAALRCFSQSCCLHLGYGFKSSLLLAVASAIGQFKWLWMSSKQRGLQDLQVFDEASRGHLGASKLLVSRRGL